MPPRISAIVLAAGRSQRMGQPKELLLVNNTPSIVHVIDTLNAGGVSRITVVIGETGDVVRKVLEGKSVKYAVNRNADSQLIESVRCGVESIDPATSGVLICPADHPLVSPFTIRALREAHIADMSMILIPCFRGTRGQPVLFPLSLAGQVFIGVPPQDIIERHSDRVKLLELDDEGTILDMDTPEQYRIVLEKSGWDIHL